MSVMLIWIFVSKMVKIAPHFYDHPSDLRWLPAYLAYAYWHSFVKLYCSLTFWNHSWGGRDLNTLKKPLVHNLDNQEIRRLVPLRSDMPGGITGLYSDESSPENQHFDTPSARRVTGRDLVGEAQ